MACACTTTIQQWATVHPDNRQQCGERNVAGTMQLQHVHRMCICFIALQTKRTPCTNIHAAACVSSTSSARLYKPIMLLMCASMQTIVQEATSPSHKLRQKEWKVPLGDEQKCWSSPDKVGRKFERLQLRCDTSSAASPAVLPITGALQLQ